MWPSHSPNPTVRCYLTGEGTLLSTPAQRSRVDEAPIPTEPQWRNCTKRVKVAQWSDSCHLRTAVLYNKNKHDEMYIYRGRDSSVGIATRYRVNSPGNPGGGEIFRTSPDRPWGPPRLLYNWYQIFVGVKRPGRDVDHPPHLAPRLKKE